MQPSAISSGFNFIIFTAYNADTVGSFGEYHAHCEDTRLKSFYFI